MTKPPEYPGITVIICALNEASNLPSVFPRIPEWVDEVLLIDGHSTDRTVEVARELFPEVTVLYQPGTGKGNALKHGFKHARGDIIVTLDADGATDPEEIPKFIEPLLKGCGGYRPLSPHPSPPVFEAPRKIFGLCSREIMPPESAHKLSRVPMTGS